MAAITDQRKKTADSTMSAGIYPSADGAAGLNTEFIPGATSLGAYYCPSDTVVNLKTIGLVVGRPYYSATVQPTNADTGAVFLAVGGTTKLEFKVYGQTTPFVSGFDQKEYWANENQKFSFRGMQIPASTEVSIQVTPTNPDMNIVWTVSILFRRVSGGNIDFQTAQALTATNTATQTIFTYTPANDSYMMTLHVEGYIVGQCAGQGYLVHNGRTAIDFGRIGQNKECTSPCIDSSGIGTYGSGGFWINAWGMKMYPQDSIESQVHTWAPDKSEWQGLVFGQSSALGGGTPPMRVFIG